MLQTPAPIRWQTDCHARVAHRLIHEKTEIPSASLATVWSWECKCAKLTYLDVVRAKALPETIRIHLIVQTCGRASYTEGQEYTGPFFMLTGLS